MAIDQRTARYAAVFAGVLTVGVAGYVGFTRFVGSDPYANLGMAALAAGTGFAAFFSPCSFPLLLTFLTRRSEESPRRAFVSSLRIGMGAVALLAIVVGGIVAVGSAFGSAVDLSSSAGRVFRLGVSSLLIFMGLGQAGVMTRRFPLFDRLAGPAAHAFDPGRTRHPARADVLYGFGYLLAGFG